MAQVLVGGGSAQRHLFDAVRAYREAGEPDPGTRIAHVCEPVLATPADARVLATFAAVIVALTLTGYFSARLGGAPVARAMARNVVGGGLAMLITYEVGNLVGLAF